MSDEHTHEGGSHPFGHSTSSGDGEPVDFGVNKITVHYHWQGKQYEVDLDPNRIDIMIFGSANVKKYKPHLPGRAGGPVKGSMNHLMPDGTRKQGHGHHQTRGGEREQWPLQEAAVMSNPRALGGSFGGSPDDFCWHEFTCSWWCVAGDHSPLEE